MLRGTPPPTTVGEPDRALSSPVANTLRVAVRRQVARNLGQADGMTFFKRLLKNIFRTTLRDAVGAFIRWQTADDLVAHPPNRAGGSQIRRAVSALL